MSYTTTGPSTSTEAEIPFGALPENGERAWANINADATGQRLRNYEMVPHTIPIQNWRESKDIALDVTGFQLGTRPTNFIKDGEVDVENYYQESINLIKEITGATRVELFDHTIRRRRPEVLEDTPDKRQPVASAHVDQTPKSAEARVHRHLPAEDVPKLLANRYQLINLWRPIRHPAWDWPLALCDYRSVDAQKDVQPVALIYPDREGETYSVQFNPNQRWGYFRGMSPDEFVLIKCFDSIRDGSVAQFTPHTGFADPKTPQDAPFRESIELRALVFYD
ncbi:hypothetical protein CYLTODRAFT_423512 [Cylindrobasidium torrendii FP15055 ss-10]|uniref:Methyltransferase n=1 Tax=Cylindrobasidium torrendii FP15055 ss-10 TaxID=1314674 RepID=A0A0D7BA11_9AGAR|nr:hypothetical protein CYLTODRAFT_423512 [Cylindrobasidium torrendii FP15055 ss-10]